MFPVDWPFAGSTLLSVRNTLASGRAVFADKQLKEGLTLLTTTLAQSPLVHVIFRPYRKEACAQCFSYDRGREWKIRDAATGTAFCSDACRVEWNSHHDVLTMESSIAVETFTKSLLKKQRAFENDGLLDNAMQQEIETGATQEFQAIWEQTEALATELRQARLISKPTKMHRMILNRAKNLIPDPDILNYTLSGVLAAYTSQKSASHSDQTHAETQLPSLFALAEDHTVFLQTPTALSPLQDYTASYLVLLAILPQPLLDFITKNLVVNLATRASHNAFSIRPEGTTDGDQSGEFIGWGVWPEASFFNHSCRPNVRKERRGRLWTFSVDANGNDGTVEDGEQLCITYLGGDERDMDVNERRQRLLDQWGFLCQCDQCVEEVKSLNAEESQV